MKNSTNNQDQGDSFISDNSPDYVHNRNSNTSESDKYKRSQMTDQNQNHRLQDHTRHSDNMDSGDSGGSGPSQSLNYCSTSSGSDIDPYTQMALQSSGDYQHSYDVGKQTVQPPADIPEATGESSQLIATGEEEEDQSGQSPAEPTRQPKFIPVAGGYRQLSLEETM